MYNVRWKNIVSKIYVVDTENDSTHANLVVVVVIIIVINQPNRHEYIRRSKINNPSIYGAAPTFATVEYTYIAYYNKYNIPKIGLHRQLTNSCAEKSFGVDLLAATRSPIRYEYNRIRDNKLVLRVLK